MIYANLVLEYLKVLLTAPVLFSLVALIFIFIFKDDIKALLLRIARIRLPGGAEISIPQLAPEEEKPALEPQIENQEAIAGLPADLTSQQRHAIEELLRSHIATAYVWEYRYLNHFLVRKTQLVLDWLVSIKQATTYAHYDSIWLPSIPSANERQTIIGVLQAHHLIQQNESGMISVTPKGREYQAWRGPLPPLPNE